MSNLSEIIQAVVKDEYARTICFMCKDQS